MASGVAHNFNNLLQMIMGGGEAALAKLDSGKIRECREAIQNILNASRRGADVVRRIKDFTLVKTEQMDQAQIFDLDELIKEAVELTKTFLKMGNKIIIFECDFFEFLGHLQERVIYI